MAASHLRLRRIIGTLDHFKFSAPPLGSGVGKVTLQDCGGEVRELLPEERLDGVGVVGGFTCSL